MASGIEHYKIATAGVEEIMQELLDGKLGDDDSPQIGVALALAQVHATLALTAATALGVYASLGGDDHELDAWQDEVGHHGQGDEGDDEQGSEATT